MTEIFLVRHCQAAGQEREARLTQQGIEQAQQLAEFFAAVEIEHIVSSPYVRAVDSIKPTARKKGLSIHTDERLVERKLAGEPREDWRTCLRQTFGDLDLCFEGGESSRAAMLRAVAVCEERLRTVQGSVIMVSHGNLITLLLKYFDHSIGFEDWEQMTNPDVYRIWHEDGWKIERNWR
ncbi:histidine phosphatase family protein [Laceyella putida]|uniref:Histidine phosphatase family protein n=1 Tax=Laceyella putida TaxID=110101 RepID=A0ABW2RML7_9BACL